MIKKRHRIVASMTTLPKRLKFIYPTLETLLNQSLKLDRIYIHIPSKTKRTGEKYDQKELDQIEKYGNGRIKINYIQEDFGPITKIAPITDVENDKNTYVLSVDDDVLISKNAVEKLYIKSFIYPDSVLGFGGLCIGRFPGYIQFVTNNPTDIEVDWLQGVHCILYPLKTLNKKEMVYEEKGDPKELWMNDDHKIAYYLEKKGIQRISVEGYIKDYITYREESKYDTLSGRGIDKLMESLIILNFMNKNKYYYRNYRFDCSISFYIFGTLIFLILFILYLYIRSSNIGSKNFQTLFSTSLLGIFILWCIYLYLRIYTLNA